MNPVHVIGGYREFTPSAEAASFCEAIWIHQTPRQPVPAGAAHRVLPEVGVSLAFRGFRDDEGRPVAWSPIIAFPKRRAQVFTLVPGLELAAIRIKPEWAGPLLGVDPMAMENQVVELSAVAPALCDRLHDGLARAGTADAALLVLMREMRAAYRAVTAPPSRIASAALDIVRRSAGRVPCERVAAAVGLSDRQLRRHVHDATGISPKTHARLLRLVESMVLADAVERPDWADIALGAGYCDQSHLIRDCVALSGLSPRDLHRERRRQVIEPATVLSNHG